MWRSELCRAGKKFPALKNLPTADVAAIGNTKPATKQQSETYEKNDPARSGACRRIDGDSGVDLGQWRLRRQVLRVGVRLRGLLW